MLRFLLTEQVRKLEPANGPETGGTVVNITVEDVPRINNRAPETQCAFPNGVSVACTYVLDTLCQCVTPTLASITNEASEGVEPFGHVTYSWAQVNMTLEKRVFNTFYFLYARDVKVTHIEPPNVVPPNYEDFAYVNAATNNANAGAISGRLNSSGSDANRSYSAYNESLTVVAYGTAFLGQRNLSNPLSSDPIVAAVQTGLRCRFNTSATAAVVVVG